VLRAKSVTAGAAATSATRSVTVTTSVSFVPSPPLATNDSRCAYTSTTAFSACVTSVAYWSITSASGPVVSSTSTTPPVVVTVTFSATSAPTSTELRSILRPVTRQVAPTVSVATAVTRYTSVPSFRVTGLMIGESLPRVSMQVTVGNVGPNVAPTSMSSTTSRAVRPRSSWNVASGSANSVVPGVFARPWSE
jgi:hypothetical protein